MYMYIKSCMCNLSLLSSNPASPPSTKILKYKKIIQNGKILLSLMGGGRLRESKQRGALPGTGPTHLLTCIRREFIA